MQIRKLDLLPVAGKFADVIVRAYERTQERRATGRTVTVEGLSSWVGRQIRTWNPKIHGRAVLDDATRAAGARFIAGVVMNLHTKE